MNCPVQRSCGGCPTLHLGRSVEHHQKAARVVDALTAAGLSADVPLPVAGQRRAGYRNRLRMKVVEGKATLFNRSKLDGCPALRPELWSAIVDLIERSARDTGLLAEVEHLEVRVGDDNNEVGLSLACLHGPNGHDVSFLQNALGARWMISCKAASIQEALNYKISPGLAISVPLNAFVQVNSEVNRLLVQHVASEAMRSGAESFIDLYAGAGNLTVPLLAKGLSGQAVERSVSAVKALASRSDVKRLTVASDDVESSLTGLTPADFVIVNPPRRGIADGHGRIADLARRSLIVVSCDPGTLADDLTRFDALGLKLERITTFDMFPGTDHIETVVTLVR